MLNGEHSWTSSVHALQNDAIQIPNVEGPRCE